jgi:hypothetical protein
MMPHSIENIVHEVFNQKSLVLTFFGSLGGSVRAAVLKTTWRESLRVTFVGGAVAFGVGVLAPSIVGPIMGNSIQHATLGTLTASAFIVGLIAVTIVERILSNFWGGKKT